MPQFDNNWQRVFEIVSQSTGASQPEAAKAADGIVKDPEAVNILATFCTASKFGMGTGGVGGQLGIPQIGQPSHLLSGLGIVDYCKAMIINPENAHNLRIKYLSN